MAHRFSKRQGFKTKAAEISTRHEAPIGLREFVIQLTYELKYDPSFVRKHVCRVLKQRPDPANWSEYPNIDQEVNQLVEDCEWYRVYDIIEALYEAIDHNKKAEFEEELNDYFSEKGIGWKLEKGVIEYRGDGHFEATVKVVESTLQNAGLPTAIAEIEEAIGDLSRRPNPDVTGAVQHSLACLECVVREVTGDNKATLGELIKKFPAIVPVPLDKAIEKLWGFSSEKGRHIKEGQAPEYAEAELVVGVSAAISTYLAKKNFSPSSQPDSNSFDLWF